jgi:thioredoxin-like negative regulator of GroEL
MASGYINNLNLMADAAVKKDDDFFQKPSSKGWAAFCKGCCCKCCGFLVALLALVGLVVYAMQCMQWGPFQPIDFFPEEAEQLTKYRGVPLQPVYGGMDGFRKELRQNSMNACVALFKQNKGSRSKVLEQMADKLGVQEIHVHFMSVDCEKEKDICTQMGITTFPTVLHFKPGTDVANPAPTAFTGSVTDADAVEDWIKQESWREFMEEFGTKNHLHFHGGPEHLKNFIWANNKQRSLFFKFSAATCPPCQVLKPKWGRACDIIERGEEGGDKELVKWISISCDEENEICGMLHLYFVPALMYIKGGSTTFQSFSVPRSDETKVLGDFAQDVLMKEARPHYAALPEPAVHETMKPEPVKIEGEEQNFA